MVVLYLNDRKADLKGDEEIAITKAINSFENLTKLQGDVSTDFNLLRTNNNQQILENAEQALNDTQVPYTAITARLYVYGLLIINGFAELVEAGEEYTVAVYGANANLFAVVRGKSIRELSMLPLEYRWNFSAVKDMRINTGGVVYPMIDFSDDNPHTYMSNTSRDVDVRVQFPAVYEYTVFDYVMQEAGYTYSGPFISDPEFLSAIIPWAEDRFQRDGNISSRINCKVSYSASEAVGSADQINFDTLVTANTSMFQPFSALNGNFTFLDRASVKFTITVSLTNTAASSNDFYVYVTSPGVGNFFSNTVTLIAGETRTEILEIIAETPYYHNGTGINPTTIFMEATLTGMVLNAGATCEIEAMDDLNDDDSLQIVYDPGDWRDLVTASGILPDIDQAAFIKYIAQKYGLVLQVDVQKKHVNIIKFDDIVNNKPNADDWSDLVDDTEKTSLSFKFDNYGQRNYCTYKDEEGVRKPSGTDYTLTIPNRNLKYEAQLYESPFGATQMVKRLVNLDVPQIKKLTAGVESLKTKPRVLYIEHVNIVSGGPIVYKDPTVPVTSSETLSIPLCWFYLPGKTYSMRWVDLIKRHNSKMEEVLQKVKIGSHLLRLDAAKIQGLDYSKPKFINGSYWFVSEVNQWKATSKESTVVKMVMI